jgi:hypothetical protein
VRRSGSDVAQIGNPPLLGVKARDRVEQWFCFSFGDWPSISPSVTFNETKLTAINPLNDFATTLVEGTLPVS